MRRPRLFWQLFATYLVVALIPLLAMTWYMASALDTFYLKHLRGDLADRAHLVARLLAAQPAGTGPAAVDALCERIGERVGTRLTVVDWRGTVLGDSDEDPAAMENHSDRPEIQAALHTGSGHSLRLSPTLRREMLYYAIPLEMEGRVTLVVRAAMPLTTIEDALRGVTLRITLAGLLLALGAAALSWLVSRRISEPLERMQEAAERFAEGDLQHEIFAPESAELGALADALNSMAAQLHARIHTITEERAEVEAVLSSMVEGVLAVDTHEHVLSINRAAARLLDVDADAVEGRPLFEVVRNPDLEQFVGKLLQGSGAIQTELTFFGERDTALEVHGTALHKNGSDEHGAVIVMHDITRLRRLEQVRRDFVANVSHELKTPVTAVKGFVETLLGGAMESPKDAERFLNIISRQADRLNAIIEDLLTLSRLERDAERAEIALSTGTLRGILKSAVEVCAPKAAEKDIAVDFDCPDDMEARLNPALFEQAVVNLVDNAINYSPPESNVHVRASRRDGEVIVSVEDQGPGIAKDQHGRIWERFYRVDRARSRSMGGTGLGLAIVKHIMQVHRGRVSLDSSLGKGSTFRLHLPG